jgi:aromatic ring-cleaving dioxygenase
MALKNYSSPMNYHAHIYFELEDLNIVQKMAYLARQLDGKVCSVWKLYTQRVGPHHLPMLEIHFSEPNKIFMTEWLESHRQDLSVLIHQETGDDLRDHLFGQAWLGDELPINFEFFEQVKVNPSLSIHPIKEEA